MLTHDGINSLKHDLYDTVWRSIAQFNAADDAYDNFIEYIRIKINYHLPHENVTGKPKFIQPSMTYGVLEFCLHKNRLYALFLKDHISKLE